jgi:hypothetical protein
MIISLFGCFILKSPVNQETSQTDFDTLSADTITHHQVIGDRHCSYVRWTDYLSAESVRIQHNGVSSGRHQPSLKVSSKRIEFFVGCDDRNDKDGFRQ